jgi:hypothetical protein
MQIMFQPDGGVPHLISWFEHFHAGANISPDIDKREMPRLYNYAHENAENNRGILRTATVTYTYGDINVHMPMLDCLWQIKKRLAKINKNKPSTRILI